MPLPIGLMLLLSGLTSAAGNAISAGTTSAANQQQAMGFARQRAEFAPLLRELRNPNFGGLERRAISDLSRASDQITANRASAGMLDAGRTGADAMMGDATVDIIAQLAEAKSQIDARNQQLIAQIISGQAFQAPDPGSFNPGRDAFLGFLGGGAAGVGQGLGTLMGTELGLEALGGLGGGGLGKGSAIKASPNITLSFPRTSGAIGGGRLGGRTPTIPSLTPFN